MSVIHVKIQVKIVTSSGKSLMYIRMSQKNHQRLREPEHCRMTYIYFKNVSNKLHNIFKKKLKKHTNKQLQIIMANNNLV